MLRLRARRTRDQKKISFRAWPAETVVDGKPVRKPRKRQQPEVLLDLAKKDLGGKLAALIDKLLAER